MLLWTQGLSEDPKSPLQKKAKEDGFERVRNLMEAKEVVQDLKWDRDWSINPIILDVKDLASSFAL